ncbi:MAG TPA: cyclic nucleotide-binding domain-containing protein [Flavisolibacter sp.]
MLILEKVLILKATALFSETPEPDLVDTAYLLEEVHAEKNTVIFNKGDIGGCMYIIHKGKVRIHDGEHVLAILEEGDFFGELSLLDTEKRSASASAEEDCILFKLEQEAFYEVLSNNVNVLKAILRTLSQRIRQIDAKSTELYKIIEEGRKQAAP